MNHVDMLLMTASATASRKISTTFRMQEVRLVGNFKKSSQGHTCNNSKRSQCVQCTCAFLVVLSG